MTRNLLGKDSFLKWTPQQLPSPPPDGEEEPYTNHTDDEAFKRQKFREDVLLDITALESSIRRIQLIQSSNQRERERYAAEKAKILETAQAVRDNTMHLRAHLASAQRSLELRKGYDKLAARLIDPEKLKPRAQTREDIGKLEKEIEELEQEGAEFEGAWVGRREAFERVIGEGRAMVRLIKGIKEEPEAEEDKDEGMEDGEEGTKGGRSRMGTPAPEGGSTPMPGEMERGGETPMPMSLESGEVEGSDDAMRPTNKLLSVEDATRANSRTGSPLVQAMEGQLDVEMDELPLEPRPKASTGMEATDDQVATPAEQMDES